MNAAEDLTPVSACEICSQLGDVERSFYKHGWPDMTEPMPAEAGRLQTVGPSSTDSRGQELNRCPVCGTYYRRTWTYEYLVNGTEDEAELRRLTPAEAGALIAPEAYERLLAAHSAWLQHPDSSTRRYAAQALAAHHLAQGDVEALIRLLQVDDSAAVHGVLSHLCRRSEDGELPPDSRLAEQVERLEGQSEPAVTRAAGYLLLLLRKGQGAV